MICYYYTAPKFLFFSEEAPLLLYYSHIPAIVLGFIFGFIILLNNPKSTLNRSFAGVSFLFATWALLNLHLWSSINGDMMTFTWSLLGICQALIAILSIQTAYVYLFKKDLGWKTKLLFLILLLPVLVLSHTDMNISGYNLSDCDAFGYENKAFELYYSLLGAVSFIWILSLFIRKKILETGGEGGKNAIFVAGILCFILTFFGTVYVSAWLAELGITGDSILDMYSLFGMIIFQGLIMFLIVKFRVFNITMSVAGALVVTLLALALSQLTFAESTTSVVLTMITVLLILVAGLFLLRSVRKEVEQKKELERLTNKLEKANTRLTELDKLKSEFVSIASHQLRSPLTAIRGYASMMAEGSFGKLPQKAQDSAERIEESAKLMATAVEDYLNVSRIESGNMKYNNSDFNLRDKVDEICDDLRPIALKHSLILLFRTDLKSRGVVNADIGKTVQIIHNLINNSIKYTPKGTISVFIRDDIKTKKIFVEITDTGIGMNKKTLDSLFAKFTRADNANSVNVSGTGLGLFVARKMAQAMGGNITAFSEGDEKGSRFTFELPLAM